MVILGLLLTVGAIVVGILVMFVMKSTKILFFVAGGLDIAAGKSNNESVRFFSFFFIHGFY